MRKQTIRSIRMHTSTTGGVHEKYTIRSFKEVTEQTIHYREQLLERHEKDMKKLLLIYRDLIDENEQILDEINQECQVQINEDMAYALQFLNIYDRRVNMRKLSSAMDDTLFLYGLSDMLARGLALVRYFVPKKGELYSTILRYYFCSNIRYSDEDVIELLSGGISRRQYYREKKEAIRFMGYYFYEIVAPQIRNGRYKPSFPEEYD